MNNKKILLIFLTITVVFTSAATLSFVGFCTRIDREKKSIGSVLPDEIKRVEENKNKAAGLKEGMKSRLDSANAFLGELRVVKDQLVGDGEELVKVRDALESSIKNIEKSIESYRSGSDTFELPANTGKSKASDGEKYKFSEKVKMFWTNSDNITDIISNPDEYEKIIGDMEAFMSGDTATALENSLAEGENCKKNAEEQIRITAEKNKKPEKTTKPASNETKVTKKPEKPVSVPKKTEAPKIDDKPVEHKPTNQAGGVQSSAMSKPSSNTGDGQTQAQQQQPAVRTPAPTQAPPPGVGGGRPPGGQSAAAPGPVGDR